jgi:hypothetical protein
VWSYGSPGEFQQPSTYAQSVDFTMAAPTAATIYYTTDMTLPVPGHATTKSGPSPVTVTLPGGTAPQTVTLRWYADFGGAIGRELTDHVMVISSLPTPIHNGGEILEHVSFAASGGPAVIVAPGATVTGSLDYQYWQSDSSGYCATCENQLVLGVDGVGQLTCINYTGPTFPGTTGNYPFTFSAPTTPGRYVMRFGDPLQFGCSANLYGGGLDVGVVVVE